MTAYLRGLMPGKKDAYSEQIRQLGVLTTIPIVLLIGPAVGFFAGGWLDRKFHIYPWFTIILIGLGFTASAREVTRLLKEIARSDSSDQNPSNE